ncbi:conjugal transfer protein TraF (plasmid) [Bermanella marisrubri]|uniref:Thioredoxin domain-containing protein n=1 Tax=Bermanella marisrubri TaxID=207949 RepID=Q1MY32_9GAMM|nr:conjugal transfer protein TraF [Bermanella marisrubri]EAT10864.1 hypothetical protein RED65_01958 [Oceanobacter sp. RED65] [Bermanella marisrubri]QIZ85917.1 conjugal transfer protein TraF [Bermanella marisrubri]
MKFILTTFAFCLSLSLSANTYFDKEEQGYWWYEPVPIEVEKDEKKKEPVPERPRIDPKQEVDPREIIAQQKEYLDYLMNKAVVYPTEKNITAFMKYNEEIQSQAQRFADTGMNLKWTNPDLNYALKKPVFKEAILAKNEQKLLETKDQLANLSQEFGLVYFMRSDCPYCKRYSPVLKQFAEKHGFSIYVVSLDGKGTEEFPYPKKTFHLAETLKVEVVPALFMARPRDRKVVPLHYGVVSETQLVGRILETAEGLGD